MDTSENFQNTTFFVNTKEFINLMKNKLSKQEQNQRADLIFKYVKTLGPYSNQEDKQLYKRINSARLDRKQRKQPSLLLTSRVYQMNVGSNKSKKKVTFLQNEQNIAQKKMLLSKQKITNLCHKQIINPSSHRVSKDQNPEKMFKDLLSLQRSIYSTFRIKDNKVTQTSASTFLSKMPLAQSNTQSKYLQLQLESKISAKTQRDRMPQSQILKCSSQSSITNNLKYDRNYKVQSRQMAERTPKNPISSHNIRPNSQTITRKEIPNSQISFSGISKLNKKQVEQMQSKSQLSSSRTSAYWKQQNDLMIQIFRKKLQSKYNLSPTKHNWK